MMLKLLMAAGGLLAVLAAGVFVRRARTRSSRITTEHLSGDWLAHARGREDQQW